MITSKEQINLKCRLNNCSFNSDGLYCMRQFTEIANGNRCIHYTFNPNKVQK